MCMQHFNFVSYSPRRFLSLMLRQCENFDIVTSLYSGKRPAFRMAGRFSVIFFCIDEYIFPALYYKRISGKCFVYGIVLLRSVI